MPRETADDVLGAMIVLSDQTPALPLQSACLGLAEVIAKYEGKMGRKAASKLLVIGAALWKKGTELGEDVFEIHHTAGGEQ